MIPEIEAVIGAARDAGLAFLGGVLVVAAGLLVGGCVIAGLFFWAFVHRTDEGED